jgi:hypothetical protein
MIEENRGNFWLVDGRDISHQAPTSYPRAVDVGICGGQCSIGNDYSRSPLFLFFVINFM